jgi:hypothetical protein
MSKRPIIDEKKLGVNPLSIDLKIKVSQLKTSESLLTEFTEGINLPVGKLEKTILLESQQYTKLYHDAFWRNIIIDLSPKALQLWTFISFDLDANKDYYWINSSFLISKFKYRNKKVLEELIKELGRYGLISSSFEPDIIWINPSIMFSGNRIKKYSNKVVIRDIDLTKSKK